jgi:hypothetical protein
LYVTTTAVNCASLLAIAVALAGAAGCSERTLLQIDITGDRRFEDVVLRLTASRPDASVAPREADFPNARFDTTNAYKAGLYLPAGWSGTVTVSAKVIEGACEVAAGDAIAHDIQAAESSAVVPILVVSHASCIPIGDGGAGGSGGGAGGPGTGGTGGSAGAGGGAAGGAGAGGTSGASGAAGSGGGSGTAGASGGRSGAGGGAAGGRAGTGGGAGAGGQSGTGGAAGAGGGIAGASGMGGGVGGGAGGAVGGTVGGTGGTVGGTGGTSARGGAGGVAGRGGTGGAGGCSQSNADACGIRNCGSAQNICGQVIPCGICRNDQCCDLGVCGPAGNPPRC